MKEKTKQIIKDLKKLCLKHKGDFIFQSKEIEVLATYKQEVFRRDQNIPERVTFSYKEVETGEGKFPDKFKINVYARPLEIMHNKNEESLVLDLDCKRTFHGFDIRLHLSNLTTKEEENKWLQIFDGAKSLEVVYI